MNFVINFHCQTRRMDYAFKMFAGIEAHGYILDVITFNTFVKGIFRVGRMEDALKHYNQILSKQHTPNFVTRQYSKFLLDGVSKTRKIHWCSWLIVVMLQKGREPNIIIFTTFMD